MDDTATRWQNKGSPLLNTPGRDAGGLAALLLEGTSVMLCGRPGMGKTFVAEAICHQLEAQGLHPLRLRATALLSAEPFGTLAACLDPRVSGLAGDGRFEAREFLDRCARHPGNGPLVLFIDEAHHLDPQSADLLARLCWDGRARLLMTCERPLERTPHLDRATMSTLDGLWLEGIARRVDFEPLDLAASIEFIDVIAAGRPLDAVTRQTIGLYGRGLPLLLRELTLDALNLGDDTRPSTAPHSARALELARYSLDGLPADALAGLALLGRADGIRFARASNVVGAHCLDILIGMRLATVSSPAREVVHVDSLLADAAVQLTPHELLEALEDGLVNALVTDDPELRDIHPGEASIIANACLDPARRSALTGITPTTLARVLLMAAHRANNRGLPDLALRYSEAAAALEPSVYAAVETSRAHLSVGRPNAALSALTAATARFRSPGNTVALLRWAASLKPRLGHTADAPAAEPAAVAARAPVDRATVDELAYQRLSDATEQMEWPRAIGAGTAQLRDPSLTLGQRMRGASLAAFSLTVTGSASRAVELVDEAWALFLDGSSDISTRSPKDEAVAQLVATALQIEFLSGARAEALYRAPGVLALSVDATRDTGALANLNYICGLQALIRGEIPAAAREFRAADLRMRRMGLVSWRPLVIAAHAMCLALLGETDAATARIAEARAVAPSPAAWNSVVIDLAEIHVTGARFGPTAASEQAWQIAEAARPQAMLLGAHAVMAGYAYSDAHSRHGVTLRDAADGVDVPLLAAFARIADAEAQGDGAALDDCVDDFERSGRLREAHFAAGKAELVHRRNADSVLSRLSAKRARGFAEACGLPVDATGPVTPAGHLRLTGREREIAILAAQGKSNGDIARELFLSVRTVESHLYQARTKLGRAPRESLGRILEVESFA
ncbi:LuxR C-terminal-related transcriptional regulator [Compostimonas suwonensis]|nr:LuxR C-terminal-related transcriptional regulator [Compostimonas suwonensis]